MAESESTEMYLKSLLELTRCEEEHVAISSIAERLGVSAVSANEMIKRLVERDMVVHTPYKGVLLTGLGLKRATNVLRRHRLWEVFLVDHLGIPWEKSHDLACQLEHATAEQVTDSLAAFLGYPERCPHGNPIPSAEVGTGSDTDAVPLSELAVGQSGVVLSVYREETPLLVYLADRSIFPGAPVVVTDIAPYNGPLSLLVQDKEVILGREIAARVMIAIR